MEPFYFDSQGHALFGCYHSPPRGARGSCAVLLCYPLGHEYLQFHRSYRQLARHVAASGFPVLRFDYFGCGDSSGDDGQGGIEHWLSDIRAALVELRQRSRSEKIGLVGARLGATLAMMAGSQYGGVHAMVLWDPVVSGKAHVREMLSAHREMLHRSHVKLKGRSDDETTIELLGFRCSQSCLEELAKIDLLTIGKRSARRALIIQSNEEPDLKDLMNHVRSMGCEVGLRCLNSPRMWLWEENFGKTLAPHHTLRAIVTWLSRVCE